MNTHDQPRETNLAILRWLAKFGYLTSAQIGQLVWPQAKTHASRTRLAQRAIARLSAAGLLLVNRRGPCLPSHVGLSRRGATELNAHLDVDSCSAKDLLRTISSHRDACNDVAISLLDDWPEVWTEREVVTGAAPFKAFGGKVPDCAAFDSDIGVLWVEIENCRRGGRDLDALAAWLHHWAFPSTLSPAFLDSPLDQHPLFRVRFVLASPAASTFPSRLVRAMTRYGWSGRDARNQVEFFDIATGRSALW